MSDSATTRYACPVHDKQRPVVVANRLYREIESLSSFSLNLLF